MSVRKWKLMQLDEICAYIVKTITHRIQIQYQSVHFYDGGHLVTNLKSWNSCVSFFVYLTKVNIRKNGYCQCKGDNPNTWYNTTYMPVVHACYLYLSKKLICTIYQPQNSAYSTKV